MIEELKIITFVCTGLNKDTKILISALKQIKSFKELFVGGIVFDDDIFNLRKCFHYYISYEHNQKINPTKSPREQFRKKCCCDRDLQTKKKRFKEVMRREQNRTNYQLGIKHKKSILQHYTHKEIREGFKLGWSAEIRSEKTKRK